MPKFNPKRHTPKTISVGFRYPILTTQEYLDKWPHTSCRILSYWSKMGCQWSWNVAKQKADAHSLLRMPFFPQLNSTPACHSSREMMNGQLILPIPFLPCLPQQVGKGRI